MNCGEPWSTLMTRLADRLATLENPPSRQSFKPKEVKDPEPFTGSQHDIKRFKNQLSLVLADADRFTDNQRQLRYYFSLLRGDAYTIMEPYVSSTGVTFPDTEAFLKEITRIFGDSDEKATVSRELEKLKQGSREFSRYYADFARLTAILDLTEESKIQTLERGITNEIRNAMAYLDTPEQETLDSYIGRLKRMDERLCQIRGQPKGAPLAPPTPRHQPTPSMATGTHPRPMDLSAARKTLSPEERGRRISGGLCFYCGGSGHLPRTCPTHPGQRISPVPATANTQIAAATIIEDTNVVQAIEQGKVDA